jgi:hypothetical protein
MPNARDFLDSFLPHPKVVLGRHSTQIPQWLPAFELNSSLPIDEFFASRVVYYPGCGIDGHPMRLFGGAHAAHCFVFADSDLGLRQTFETQLENENDPDHPRGYRALIVKEVPDLMPSAAYVLFSILERVAGFDDDHGVSRLAILLVGAEGADCYNALFCGTYGNSPYGILVEDHGFGTYPHFGKINGPLHQLATRNGLPEWLLLGLGDEVWPGYEVTSCGAHGDRAALRLLFRRATQAMNDPN